MDGLKLSALIDGSASRNPADSTSDASSVPGRSSASASPLVKRALVNFDDLRRGDTIYDESDNSSWKVMWHDRDSPLPVKNAFLVSTSSGASTRYYYLSKSDTGDGTLSVVGLSKNWIPDDRAQKIKFYKKIGDTTAKRLDELAEQATYMDKNIERAVNKVEKARIDVETFRESLAEAAWNKDAASPAEAPAKLQPEPEERSAEGIDAGDVVQSTERLGVDATRGEQEVPSQRRRILYGLRGDRGRRLRRKLNRSIL